MRLAPLTANPEVIAALSDLPVEVVANGASVSFMHPLAQEVAADFWSDSLARAARGTRVVLGAWEGDALIATVTLSTSLAAPFRFAGVPARSEPTDTLAFTVTAEGPSWTS